ncbi:MAG: hypothetical protein ACD_23C00404G0004 [uncultured bacterium]|nr:MAG: hypothetical protein ACD_23C00404G0004 [uncultured bacterium]
MDLGISPEEISFRREVADFVKQHLPETVKQKVLFGQKLEKEEYVNWQQALYRRGWIAPSWPKEYGGCGWSLSQRRVFLHELALQCAPETIPFGVSMVGPVIYTFGSQAQKDRYLPGVLQSTTWWCQGFSEPGAGSDLAALRTRAQDCGDYYLVNGQKAWTTHGLFADMMFCLARTSDTGKSQTGISFLLLDMKSPGVEVRPVSTIDEGKSICEVFLRDVKVPKDQLVGEEGKGWTYAKFLLGHERAMIARVGRSRLQLQRAIAHIKRSQQQGKSNSLDVLGRARICEIEARLRALELTELRVQSEYHEGKGFDGTGASMLKIEGTEICQSLTQLLLDLNGAYAYAYPGRYDQSPLGDSALHGLMGDHLFNRVATIYGGSNEVQRNVIAKTEMQM